MRLCVLYRKIGIASEDEAEIAALEGAGFVYLSTRTQVREGDLVVGRYSCWPFYKELENDVLYNGAKLLNTSAQHQYIADLGNWVVDLKELTPETWSDLQSIPDQGPFILKGGTNSRKGYWRTHCFAENKADAIAVHGRLSDDSLIGRQSIYIRKFEKLYTYMYDIQGMPVTKEFRFFVCDKQVVCGGFYWSNWIEEITPPDISEVPQSFLNEVIERIGDKARAYALDVALKEDGTPIVIELNDLQQSGLSCNNPNVFYNNLYSILKGAAHGS